MKWKDCYKLKMWSEFPITNKRSKALLWQRLYNLVEKVTNLCYNKKKLCEGESTWQTKTDHYAY